VGLYSPLVIHWCRQARISATEYDDLTQESFAAVARGLNDYRKNHRGVSFCAWMRGIARHKLHDYFRRRAVSAQGGTAAEMRLRAISDQVSPPELSEGPTATPRLYRRALEIVQVHFEERTWRAFWKVVIENVSPAAVPMELEMTLVNVRQAKSRVLRRLKTELGELIE
jgi:RNA polymerase sigma-70 factor, ECF subfamily